MDLRTCAAGWSSWRPRNDGGSSSAAAWIERASSAVAGKRQSPRRAGGGGRKSGASLKAARAEIAGKISVSPAEPGSASLELAWEGDRRSATRCPSVVGGPASIGIVAAVIPRRSDGHVSAPRGLMVVDALRIVLSVTRALYAARGATRCFYGGSAPIVRSSVRHVGDLIHSRGLP